MRVMAAVTVVGTFLVAHCATVHFAVLASGVVFCLVNLAKWVATRDVSHIVYGTLTAIIVLANVVDRIRADRKLNLKGELADLRGLVETNAVRLDEKDRQIAHAGANLTRLELEIVQANEQILRLKGFAYSRERRALRTRPSGPPRRVLIVEDHAPTGERLARYLELHGLHVESCRTADEAVRLLASGQRYDVVLLDLLVPGDPDDDAPGMAVLRAIRQGRTPAPAVVVVTGSDNPAHHDRARNHGAAAVLVKPVDLDELLALLGVEEVA